VEEQWNIFRGLVGKQEVKRLVEINMGYRKMLLKLILKKEDGRFWIVLI
jgi:hypothetical protein